jgi:phosphatidylglycerophosphate synthase
MDSVFDRWGEGVVYVGIAAGCVAASFDVGIVLTAAALTSAFMVSYTRAKSESEGFTPGKGMANVGLAPREVRIVILTVAMILTAVMGGTAVADAGGADVTWSLGRPALAIGLGLIALLATITTIQRIVHVVGQSSKEHE